MIRRTYFAEVRETPRKRAKSKSAHNFGVLAENLQRLQWILTVRGDGGVSDERRRQYQLTGIHDVVPAQSWIFPWS